jgi:UDP:flavonoid glycosyltransferase YjiC (YdhE family)
MHYLVAMWDAGGTAPPELGTARRLIARGHTATVISDPTLAAEATKIGAKHRSWVRAPHRVTRANDDDVLKDWETANPLVRFGRFRDRIITGPAGAYAADVREVLQAEPAAAVLVSSPLLGAMVGAESMGVPFAVLNPNIYFRKAPGIPIIGMGLRPAVSPLGRLRDAAFNKLADSLWDKGLPAFNAARAELGLDPVNDIWEQWDRAARVMVLTSQSFDFPAELPDNVRYSGPVLDDPAWTEPCDPPPGDDPLVVVGLSTTYMKQADVLRRIVAALDTLPVRAVVTTGPGIDPADVPGTAKVKVVRSAPHAQLFTQASAVITHAGHGTLIKALAAGLPVLCVPMGRDQPDNVVRAEQFGSVLRIRPSARPAAIAGAVRRLLTDADLRSRAQEYGAQLRAESESPLLADELEAIAQQRRTA